jgi:hypothetical protein
MTVVDLKAEFQRETGIYASTDSDSYREWLEERALQVVRRKRKHLKKSLKVTSEPSR